MPTFREKARAINAVQIRKNCLDGRTQIYSGRCSPTLAALGALNWPEEAGGQSQVSKKRQVVKILGTSGANGFERISSLHQTSPLALIQRTIGA
jgi:hypothetical protein